MSMGWGLASKAELIEYNAASDPGDGSDLEPGEVAILQDLAAIYGTPEDLVALADRIKAKWGGPRKLRVISAEIARTWQPPHPTAVPYLEAMDALDLITDMYYQDSAASIVRYFLGNATTWRGEDARRIKAELKSMLEGMKR